MQLKPFEDVWKAVNDPYNSCVPRYYQDVVLDPVLSQLLKTDKAKKVLKALGVYSIKRVRLNTTEHKWSIGFANGTVVTYSRDQAAFDQKESLKDVFAEIERMK